MKILNRITIILLLILFIPACSKEKIENDTINYNLKISDIYEEKIYFSLPTNAYEIADEDLDYSFISLEYSLLYDEQEPIHSNHNEKYIKTINKTKNSIDVNLKYNYIENDFLNSNYIKNCFENYEINSEEEYFEIKLSGEFYCRYDKNLNITITSNHNVLNTNGSKSKNIVTWNINASNYKNTDIYYKIARNYETMATVAFNDEPNNSSASDLIKSVAIMSFIGISGFLIIKIIKKKFELE